MMVPYQELIPFYVELISDYLVQLRVPKYTEQKYFRNLWLGIFQHSFLHVQSHCWKGI
jgi:hypothetical protein